MPAMDPTARKFLLCIVLASCQIRDAAWAASAASIGFPLPDGTDGGMDLWESIQSGSYRRSRQLIKQGADVNWQNPKWVRQDGPLIHVLVNNAFLVWIGCPPTAVAAAVNYCCCCSAAATTAAAAAERVLGAAFGVQHG